MNIKITPLDFTPLGLFFLDKFQMIHDTFPWWDNTPLATPESFPPCSYPKHNLSKKMASKGKR